MIISKKQEESFNKNVFKRDQRAFNIFLSLGSLFLCEVGILQMSNIATSS